MLALLNFDRSNASNSRAFRSETTKPFNEHHSLSRVEGVIEFPSRPAHVITTGGEPGEAWQRRNCCCVKMLPAFRCPWPKDRHLMLSVPRSLSITKGIGLNLEKDGKGSEIAANITKRHGGGVQGDREFE